MHDKIASRKYGGIFMLSIIVILAVVALDQITKIICAGSLGLGEGIDIIKGVLSITYVENRGAAFGILQNAQAFFIIATILACGALAYFMIREYSKMHTLMRISLALIFAGALGNFIDRVILGYVRDMIYFELINFPVFNIADSAICVGAAILIIDVLFFKGKTYFDNYGKKHIDNDIDEEK